MHLFRIFVKKVMLKIGLTGNYHSGLDVVSEIFKLNYKIPVYEADLNIKFMLFNDSATIRKIENKFSKNAFTNNKVDLNKFSDNDRFNDLMKLIEPNLFKNYIKWMSTKKSQYTIFKSQILHEIGWTDNMNFNITVYKDNSFRASEIVKLNNISYIDANNMIDNEMDTLIKNRLSNYVIHNYITHNQTLHKQINTINQSILAKSY